MDAENWVKIKSILQDVLDVAPAERDAYLDSLGLDDEPRAEVESLMAFENEAEDMMKMSAVEFSKDFIADDSVLSGQEVGPYRIIRELGHGGMGAVYLAERIDGKFSQRVALKLLKREMNTSALRRRFQQEREILASLEHPNIARLLDTGTTADKVPFLAMEYVEGLPIDDYCNKHQADLNERLDLFRKVCATVDFAHRNLVVHRDLKPSNILITEDGIPKLLDFGISKILSADIENTATVTKLGVMTPSYASPEQLRNESVTTATDVYSLGVILYELLSGHRPFESKESNLKDIFQAVIDVDPPLPSSMVATFSKTTGDPLGAKADVRPDESARELNQTMPDELRHTSPQTISIKPQYLRGDLDNIVLKALKKDPERRYSSPENFSDDIKRHMDGQPVTARPDTFSYRAEKFIKRNSFTVLAAAVICVTIFGGVIATLWQARVASAERARAEKRFNDVRQLANSNIFEVYPEIENIEGSLKAREIILSNALRYLDSLYSEVESDPELQSELATAYEKIGDVQGAMNNSSLGNIQAGLDSYEKASRLRESVLAAAPADIEAKEKLANNRYVIARTLWNNSQTDEASEAFERALLLRRELVDASPQSVTAKNRLAVLLIDYGAIPLFNFQTSKALALYNEAATIIQQLRVENPDDPLLKKSLTRLIRSQSKAKASTGDLDGAINDLKTAISLSRELASQFPDDFPVQRSVWLTETIMCEVYIDSGRSEGIVDVCIGTVNFPESARKKEPENGVVAFDLAISHFNLARAYRIADQPAKTIASSENALKVMSALSAKNPADLEYKRNLAIYSIEIARANIKLTEYRQAVESLRNVISDLEPIIMADSGSTTVQYDLGIAHRLYAEASFKTDDRATAQRHIDEAISICTKLSETDSLRDSDKGLLAQLTAERSDYYR